MLHGAAGDMEHGRRVKVSVRSTETTSSQRRLPMARRHEAELATALDAPEARNAVTDPNLVQQTKGQLIEDLKLALERAAHHDDNGEYWLARELYPLLGYKSWQSFVPITDKAKAACAEVGEAVDDHFMDVHKM